MVAPYAHAPSRRLARRPVVRELVFMREHPATRVTQELLVFVHRDHVVSERMRVLEHLVAVRALEALLVPTRHQVAGQTRRVCELAVADAAGKRLDPVVTVDMREIMVLARESTVTDLTLEIPDPFVCFHMDAQG